MNILFFLTPKSEVAYLYHDYTLSQALDKMDSKRYSAIPVINQKGEYVYTLTEGDILWFIRGKKECDIYEAGDIPISKIPRKLSVEPVSINAKIEDLYLKSMSQNFVPVIDDDGTFIGIVTRKDIIQYIYNELQKQRKKEQGL